MEFPAQGRVVGAQRAVGREGGVRICHDRSAALLVAAIAVAATGPASAHDPHKPELNAWFKSLKNKAGAPCCDGGDGEQARAEWDMGKAGYKVQLKNPQRPDEPGTWFLVPDTVVIQQPNLSGAAMVWWWPSYDIDGTMTPQWRCFIPGPGS
ncbi:hypothetical protein CI1B_57810 [Bradyrhizobium ivorense]|uniref:Uncharacterized protein n=1 Tax=Bradyrhizobium ivorense TaxID=2511166 RepID=A0A508TLP5_9BRAD|nr:hypothetical protein CI1B_57810 [Bradyrhizobium ivorense]